MTQKKNRWALWWKSEDGQSELHGGTYGSKRDALGEKYVFRAELLSMCADDDERDGIDDGSFEAVEVVK